LARVAPVLLAARVLVVQAPTVEQPHLAPTQPLPAALGWRQITFLRILAIRAHLAPPARWFVKAAALAICFISVAALLARLVTLPVVVARLPLVVVVVAA
jgi:hypothetical protein